MSEPTLKAIVIQKLLELPEQEALKILVFIAGMEAGRAMQADEKAAKETLCGRVC